MLEALGPSSSEDPSSSGNSTVSSPRSSSPLSRPPPPPLPPLPGDAGVRGGAPAAGGVLGLNALLRPCVTASGLVNFKSLSTLSARLAKSSPAVSCIVGVPGGCVTAAASSPAGPSESSRPSTTSSHSWLNVENLSSRIESARSGSASLMMSRARSACLRTCSHWPRQLVCFGRFCAQCIAEQIFACAWCMQIQTHQGACNQCNAGYNAWQRMQVVERKVMR